MPQATYQHVDETVEQVARRRAARAAESAEATAALYRTWAREEPDPARRQAYQENARAFSKLAEQNAALAKAVG